MPASTVISALRDPLRQWEVIRDCIAGEFQVKFRGDKYLPRPDAANVSNANKLRYAAYVTRAVFYNVVKRTIGGLVGQIYSREPIIEVPKEMDVIIEDATGLGIAMTQLSKLAAGQVVAYGRSGIFIDYPDTGGTVTRAELLAGDIRPLFTVYDPQNIINWRWIKRGGRNVLTLVVLRGTYVKSDDGFVETTGAEYKVLRLSNNQYTLSIYRDDNNSVVSSSIPTDAAGNSFTEIPFSFIGSENNEPSIDPAPLYDLSSLNIAHYRNSADYEESCYISGQPTAFFSGLSKQWVDEVLKGEILMGARAAIPLPVGAAAGIIQANPNILPFEAMKHKERQMVALGAKLVEPSAVQRTATEASIDQSYETSTLSASADNVSDAFTFALKWAAKFMGVEPEEKKPIRFELNTEFDLIKLSSNERASLIAEWVGNAITFGEMRANLRRAGVATIDDDEAQKTIIKEAKERQALAPKPEDGAPKDGAPKPQSGGGSPPGPGN